MTDDQLHAQCLAAVEALRLDEPMTDAEAAHMVERIKDLVRNQEKKLDAIRIMAESMVRKQRETDEMSDPEAANMVKRIIAYLSRS